MKAPHVSLKVTAEYINSATGQWEKTNVSSPNWESAMKTLTTWTNRADYRNITIQVSATLPWQDVANRSEYDAYVNTDWEPNT